jgi:predicted phosphoribosyltransferase
MFYDRTDAGLQLAGKLTKYAHRKDCIILAVPRGGVPVGFAAAESLGLPLDVILAKKIGHPMNREYAIGAASLSDYFVVPHEDVTENYITEELQKVRIRLKEMEERFIGNRPVINPENKTVILIDDGIATGNTLLATVRLIRKRNPAKLVIAVPVASYSAAEKLSVECDEFVCLLIPDMFGGVGGFYERFDQVSDEEVKDYLGRSRHA